MSAVSIRVGLTRRADGYSPMSDGWRPGARQARWSLDALDLPTVDDPLTIVEAVFVATNAPQEVIDADPVAGPIYRALLERQRAAFATPEANRSVTDWWLTEDLRSLSVGDTVTLTIAGRSGTWACEPTGWRDVTTEQAHVWDRGAGAPVPYPR